MKKPTFDEINNLYNKWCDYNENSWERGQQTELFINFGEQSPEDVGESEKESLVINKANTILKTAQAYQKNAELSLVLYSNQDADQGERLAFESLVSSIMLSKSSRLALEQSSDKVLSFGQAVLHVDWASESQNTLNKILKINHIEDPRTVFFDVDCLKRDFSDSRHCGIRKKIKAESLKKQYSSLRNIQNDEDCIVYDAWYKNYKKTEFIKIQTGEFKRVDLLDQTDIPQMDEEQQPIKEMGIMEYISYIRVCNKINKPLEYVDNMNTKYIPLIYNYAFTFWNPAYKKFESIPICYYLIDPQKCYNLIYSTLIHQAKNVETDIYFWERAGLSNEDKIELQNAADYGGHHAMSHLNYKREIPQQISQTLIAMLENAQQALENIAGAYVGNNANKIQAISGVAIDKMLNRTDLVQNNAISAYTHTINQVGSVIKDWIPSVYHEQRVVNRYQANGIKQIITINEPVQIQQQQNQLPGVQVKPIVIIKNNVNKIKNNYEYTIKVSPSKEMRQQNSQVLLQSLYSMDKTGEIVNNTIDLFIDALDIDNKEELKRRLMINIPQSLIAFGRDEISYDDYQQESAQAAQPQQMQAQQLQQINLQKLMAEVEKLKAEVNLINSKAQGEGVKAGVSQYSAIHNAKIGHAKNLTDIANLNIQQQKIDAENLKDLSENLNNANTY